MEYELKKKEILSNVEFTNLLSFSLVENKLERNFRNIVEALMLNQAKTDALNQDHLEVKQNHEKELQKISGLLQEMNKKLQSIQNLQKNNDPKPQFHSILKLQCQKQVEPIISKKSLQKINIQSDETQQLKSMLDNMNQKMKAWQNRWDQQKSDLMKQIQNMKDKLDSVGFLENQLKNFRNDLRTVRDELANNMTSQVPLSHKRNSSHRSIVKRQSILSMISHKLTDKQILEPSKNTLKNVSKDENKENHLHGFVETKNEQNQQNTLNQSVQKEINLLYLELNTMKISFEELRDLLSDSRKQIFKNNTQLSELKDDLNREVKTRKTETQDLEKVIKDLQMQMLNVETTNNNQNETEDPGMRESAKTGRNGKQGEDDVNYKNQLNDKFSKMQGMLQNLVTSTEFNRLKNELNDQIQRLTNRMDNMEQNLQNSQKKLEDLIVQYQMNTNSDLGQVRNRINEMEQAIKNESSQNQRKNNILNAKIQELKKSLQNLREDIEFYQSLNTENSKTKTDKKSEQSPNTQTDQHKAVPSIDDKALQALKKYFSCKMHDLRTNLLGLIRDLEKKLNTKSNGEQQIIKIWDRLNEINLFMNKKADQDDVKKTFIYLEKKISRLNSALFKNEDNTDDARIARSNQWQCLSCDKNLHSYQGKIGKHLVWDTMPLKGINKSFINPTDDKKKGLPQLKK